MVANAIYAMNCSLGKLPVKKFVKYSEGTETVETFEHDIKAFPAIWDKLMNALDYYPKEIKEKIENKVLEESLDRIENIVKKRFEK